MTDNDDYEEVKKTVQILILGPYGKDGLNRLSHLKKFLRDNEYQMADLVNDKIDPPNLQGKKIGDKEFAYEKSMHYLKLSQINIFVFFKDIDHGSVLIEMVTAIISLKMLCCTTFLIEEGTKLDTLTEGFLQSNNCTRFTFSNSNELEKKSRIACWNHIVNDECDKYGILKVSYDHSLPNKSSLVLTPEEILEKMLRKKPEWIGYHDHFWSIPNTESFVFYPYNENEANEKELNEKYGKYGYKVIVKPKIESEYNSAQNQPTYKVLILEPNFDERKIDEGCELIAQFFRDYWSKGGYDLFEK